MSSLGFDQILKIAYKGDIKTIEKILDQNETLLHHKSGGHNKTLIWAAVNKGRFKLLQYLVEKGGNIHTPGRNRSETFLLLKPYCIAIKKKYLKIAEYLKEKGNIVDIYSAAYLGHESELKQLLKSNKAILNRPLDDDSIWETTPLHYAIAGGNTKIIQYLLDQGASVNINQSLLYEIPSRRNNLNIIQLITYYGGKPDSLDAPSALYSKNKEIIDFFFQNGVDPNKRGAKNWPPIVYVSRGDKGEHPEKVKSLLAYGAEINAKGPHGKTALHVAAKAGFTKVVKVLLENGADTSLKNDAGETPLMVARKNKKKHVEALLSEAKS